VPDSNGQAAGILVTPNAGNSALTFGISSAGLTVGVPGTNTTGALVVQQFNPQGSLSIGSGIFNNSGGGTTSFVKAGPGTLLLTFASSSYTGNSYIVGGILNVANYNLSPGTLGSGSSGRWLPSCRPSQSRNHIGQSSGRQREPSGKRNKTVQGRASRRGMAYASVPVLRCDGRMMLRRSTCAASQASPTVFASVCGLNASSINQSPMPDSLAAAWRVAFRYSRR